MKSLAVCYSEHAIKVSDSYCSGPSNKPYIEARPSPTTIQNAVTCIYKVRLSNQKRILIRLTWCSKLHNRGFLIGFSGRQTLHCSSSHKFKENSFFLQKVKGIKTLDSCGLKIKVLWDLTRARYDSGPEPINGFYIIVLVDSELTLFLGDDVEQELETLMKRASNYTRASEFSLISRCESYSGNGLYTTRAKFSDTGPCHDITIKCVRDDDDQTKMDLSVCIDKKIVTEVKRLNWNFRGNQTIFLDGLLIDLMWDVHDWLFSTGYGVFMFRTRHGFDSRLWYVEKKKKSGHGDDDDDDEKVGFSLLICACQNPD